MWVTKLLISQVKKKDFLPQNDQIWPKIGVFGQFGPGYAGLFGALLVGRLVDVARGLYLARHLFTLFIGNSGTIKAKTVREYTISQSSQAPSEPALFAKPDCKVILLHFCIEILLRNS